MMVEARVLRLARFAGLAFLAMAAVEFARQLASPGGMDFVSFWAAARLAVAGHPAAASSIAAHAAAEGAYAPASGLLPFAYPPPFLLLLLQLGLLPPAFWTTSPFLRAARRTGLPDGASSPAYTRCFAPWAHPPLSPGPRTGAVALAASALAIRAWARRDGPRCPSWLPRR